MSWNLVGRLGTLLCALSGGIGLSTPLSAQQTMATTREVLSTSAEVLARPVTVRLDNVSLRRAIDAVAGSANVPVQYRTVRVNAYTAPVTLHAQRMPLSQAFATILAGTSLQLAVLPDARLGIIEVAAPTVAQEPGMITGRVTEARTQRPLRGAKVSLDDHDRVAETGDDGTFRVTGVSAGSHTVAIKLLGYAKVTRTVAMPEGGAIDIDVGLESSATALEQVVVTGTIVATELKAVPNAITVITAKQIEERGITHIDQLFRGDVPGLFAQNQGEGAVLGEVVMFSRGATALSANSVGVSQTLLNVYTNPMKTYVDGVELADPQYLSQIDPKSIERIEILTGPQASTIYGSNAINGVMQIFTKRGTSSTPQLTLNLLSGLIQNNFSNALIPQHDYNAQLNGLDKTLSYNAGGSWNYMGPWTASNQTARTNAFGGIRLDLPTPKGRATADFVLRRDITQNRQYGSDRQGATKYIEDGWWIHSGTFGRNSPAVNSLTGFTLGLKLGYMPTNWWSHEFGFGQDAEDTERLAVEKGYTDPSDSTLLIYDTHNGRRSYSYVTTARIPVTSMIQATVTLGTDAWQNLTSNLVLQPQALAGVLSSPDYNVYRQPEHNTGSFIQTEVNLRDHLFLTYGLRAEWNNAFGTAAQPNYAPRYGVAYTQEFGPVTTKLRGSYGRSTRPPLPSLKVAQLFGGDFQAAAAGIYDLSSMYYRLGNPDLGPEHQQGGEGGLELYFGGRVSLVITRYNQTIDGLIDDLVKADSVRSLVPTDIYDYLDADGYGYMYERQYVNIGSIRNQGWEVRGSYNTGPFVTHGTYSWTKSRVIGITPRYRTQFPANSYPQYQPGATFNYLPEHTWAVGTTYAKASTTVSLNVTGTSQTMIQFGNELYFDHLTSLVRLPQNRWSVTAAASYRARGTPHSGYALVDLTMSRKVWSRVDGMLQVQNLTNRYRNDYSPLNATMGRQTKGGLRVRI